ncbi:MAG: glutamate--tRNA ligase [Candidatus Latescibacterota bacterium]|nr:MAG: glutamate--tRNA ligase [Candidatus Latescibacterota bacterium]
MDLVERQNDVVRVRFAPSPTGHLHVGGARTALYNYLYARKNGGVFVLRIEDTDAARSTRESYEGILRGMRWLGLEWDEGPDIDGPYGPYVQSARSVLYHSEADRLLREGKAYRCFCAAAELDAMRAAQETRGEAPKYDGRCRSLGEAEIEEKLAAGAPSVVRFAMPREGETRFRDVVRGDFSFGNAELDDFVLIKSDGRPTYNYAVVVDDAHMRISHVIRGDDHISNTPRQVRLYDALGYRLPKFAHLPMILGADKTRLSKRHGATSVDAYRDLHYLSEAMVNYLALLGWSFDGKRELFSFKALIEAFSLKRVSSNPAVFDLAKMEWINAEHFKMLPPAEKLELVAEALEEEGLLPPAFEVDLSRPVDLKLVAGKEPLRIDAIDAAKKGFARELPRLALIIEVLGNRLKLLRDVRELMGYFYTDDFARDETAVRNHLASKEAASRLEALALAYEDLQYFDRPSVEETLRALADRLGLQSGELIHPCRVALTGKTVSPDIFWVIVLLGKAKTVERLCAAAANAPIPPAAKEG